MTIEEADNLFERPSDDERAFLIKTFEADEEGLAKAMGMRTTMTAAKLRSVKGTDLDSFREYCDILDGAIKSAVLIGLRLK